MKRPLLIPLMACIAGITGGAYFEIPIYILLALLAASFFALLLSFRYCKAFTLIFLSAIFFLLGITHMEIISALPRDAHHVYYKTGDSLHSMEGVITDISYPGEGTNLTVSLYRIYEHGRAQSSHGRIYLSVRTNQTFFYGDVIRFKTRLKEPRSFKNPGVFDYARYLRYRGIWARGIISQPSAICVIRSGYGNPFLMPFMGYREFLRRVIGENAPYPASAIIQACVLGLQNSIPRELMEKFNRTGTSHIIAISGFNMAILAGFVGLTMRWLISLYPSLLLYTNLQLISTIFATLSVVFYTFIAGAGISVIRATITILVFMLAFILGRIRDSENTVCLAALVILLISPYLLFDLAFQLSFSAVYALIYMTPKLMALLPSMADYPPLLRKTLKTFYTFLATTLSAAAGTLPIIVFHFHRLSPLIIISNILVVPILGFLVVPLSMIIMIFAPLSSSFSHLIITITAKLADLSVLIVGFFASLPYSTLLLPGINFWQIGLYLGTLYFCLMALRGGTRAVGYFILSIFLFFSLTLSFCIPLHSLENKLELTCLDVGQGQAIYVRTSKETMLIDGGGFYNSDFDVGRNIIAPFLLHKGVTRLSRIVLTHPHPDHVGGLIYIIKNFPVEEIWVNEDAKNNENSAELLTEAYTRKIPVRVIYAGFVHNTAEATKIEALHPPKKGEFLRVLDENDRSLVLKLTHGKISFLLPADISERAEGLLLLRDRKKLKSDVLLVPHHGSRHSSSPPFLEAVKPHFACVSAAGSSHLMLPNPKTIERYRDMAIPLFQTEKHGAVTFLSDGSSLVVKTFVVASER